MIGIPKWFGLVVEVEINTSCLEGIPHDCSLISTIEVKLSVSLKRVVQDFRTITSGDDDLQKDRVVDEAEISAILEQEAGWRIVTSYRAVRDGDIFRRSKEKGFL